jgi:hypothetical protein
MRRCKCCERPMTAFADTSGGLVRAIPVREESPREGGAKRALRERCDADKRRQTKSR